MEKSFQKEARDFYAPYYANGDKAHLIDHADSVCNLALEINHCCEEKLVILASYLHDLFNAEDRKNHNKLAYEYVLKQEDRFLKELEQSELLEVAHAVLEHRASFKGEFYSKLSELISAADRGRPNLKEVVIRSMGYNNENAEDVAKHIKEKYATDGYANYPKVYKELFAKELAEFQKEADDITVERVLELYSEAS